MRYGKLPLWRRIISSPITSVVSVVALVVLVHAGWNIHAKARAGAERLHTLQMESARLEDRRDQLSQAVSYLSTERGVETEMRTKFHAVRPGESVAVIVDGPSDTASGSIPAVATSTPGWWGRMLRAVGF